MKRFGLVLLSIFLLVALMAVPSSARAEGDATCVSDPPSGPVGTVFIITCYGFSPNTWIYPYTVEPDGTAIAGPQNFIDIAKSDAGGTVTFAYPTKILQPGFGWTQALGTWTLVAEEIGLAKSVVHRGVVSINLYGDAEGVSGAQLWANQSVVVIGQDGLILYGSGFQPFEMVSLWFEQPNGECSSFTIHTDFGFNDFYWSGDQVLALTTVKADAAGSFSVPVDLFPDMCQGEYHLVARGNASGWGGDTRVTIGGPSVTETASLVANTNPVYAQNDVLSFTGWGFQPFEHITCWLTTPGPQSRTSTWFYSDIKADAGGSFTTTGITGAFTPDFPIVSEGAPGEWAMTCRGDVSGATAIARYLVVNIAVDP